MTERRKIALGMSGGVDSSMAAVMLMRSGYDVLGTTCVFAAGAATDAAVRDARIVCAQLGIEHVVRDCSDDFDQSVVRPFIADYARGATPIPCVPCNARCKIPALLAAADEHGCQKIATGHYVRVVQMRDTGRFAIKTALDFRKDQSYMLSGLSQSQLARFVAPLGGTTKLAVRMEAADEGLAVAERPESQDVCFIDGDYRDYLAAHGVASKAGDIVDGSGRVVGRHTGLAGYTIGQRKGIGVAAARPYYVIGKQIGTNCLIVGFEEEAFIDEVRAADANWQAFERLDAPLECGVKLRYRSAVAACTVQPDAEGIRIRLASLQPATAPGQRAVFYQGDTVLGGATIEWTGRNGEGSGAR
jgi:tRNA-specific 2-thiouridylase